MIESRVSKAKTYKFVAFCVALRALRHFNDGTTTQHHRNLVKYVEGDSFPWFPTFLDTMPSYMTFSAFIESMTQPKGKAA
jgi:hypothetical protein